MIAIPNRGECVTEGVEDQTDFAPSRRLVHLSQFLVDPPY